MSSILRRSSSLSRLALSHIKFLQPPSNPNCPLKGFHSICAPNNYLTARRVSRFQGNPAFIWGIRSGSGRCFIFLGSPVRFSTSSSVVEVVDWSKKWPVDVSGDSNVEAQHKEHGTYITVKAYLLGTSVDLKGLQSEHLFDIVPPNSRSANYVILRCTDNMPDYSSNLTKNDEEGYLQIVRKYASGLLSETRKDDVAWKNAKYAELWEYLQDEYELTQRFGISTSN